MNMGSRFAPANARRLAAFVQHQEHNSRFEKVDHVVV